MLILLESILNDDRTFVYILRGVAIIALLAGLASLIGTILFLVRSIRVKGTLVSWVAVRNEIHPSKRPLFRPVVTFAGGDGSVYRVTGQTTMRFFGAKPKLAPGSPIAVRYVQGHPEDARVATIANLWFFPGIALAAGGFLAYVAF